MVTTAITYTTKIVIHETEPQDGKLRRQNIDIYYSFVGKVDLLAGVVFGYLLEKHLRDSKIEMSKGFVSINVMIIFVPEEAQMINFAETIIKSPTFWGCFIPQDDCRTFFCKG